VQGLGATCRLSKGHGGLPDPFGHLSMPGFASEVGECAEFTQGAVSPVIKVVMGLVGMRTSPDGERVGVGLTVGMGTYWGMLAH
jgi:hypothetical protein